MNYCKKTGKGNANYSHGKIYGCPNISEEVECQSTILFLNVLSYFPVLSWVVFWGLQWRSFDICVFPKVFMQFYVMNLNTSGQVLFREIPPARREAHLWGCVCPGTITIKACVCFVWCYINLFILANISHSKYAFGIYKRIQKSLPRHSFKLPMQMFVNFRWRMSKSCGPSPEY